MLELLTKNSTYINEMNIGTLVSVLRTFAYDSGRLGALKLLTSCIKKMKADDFIKILNTFVHDSDKVNTYNFIYSIITDPETKKQFNDFSMLKKSGVFDYSSSLKQLPNYVEQKTTINGRTITNKVRGKKY